MARPLEILRHMDVGRFSEILAASPKRFREELYRRAGVRVKGSTFTLHGTPKNLVRVERLFSTLQEGGAVGDDVVEELIRNYLYTRRDLLADALDHFHVPHDHGLTDVDLSFIEALDLEGGRTLREVLETKHRPADIELYFAFMKIPGA